MEKIKKIILEEELRKGFELYQSQALQDRYILTTEAMLGRGNEGLHGTGKGQSFPGKRT